MFKHTNNMVNSFQPNCKTLLTTISCWTRYTAVLTYNDFLNTDQIYPLSYIFVSLCNCSFSSHFITIFEQRNQFPFSWRHRKLGSVLLHCDTQTTRQSSTGTLAVCLEHTLHIHTAMNTARNIHSCWPRHPCTSIFLWCWGLNPRPLHWATFSDISNFLTHGIVKMPRLGSNFWSVTWVAGITGVYHHTP